MPELVQCVCHLFSYLHHHELGMAYLGHDDVIKWKHFPRYWPFVRGIQRSPVNSLHKGQWRGALTFSLMCVWINGWVNNREDGDLRHHRAHYDVTVMVIDSTAPCNLLDSSSTFDPNEYIMVNSSNILPIWFSTHCGRSLIKSRNNKGPSIKQHFWKVGTLWPAVRICLFAHYPISSPSLWRLIWKHWTKCFSGLSYRVCV